MTEKPLETFGIAWGDNPPKPAGRFPDPDYAEIFRRLHQAAVDKSLAKYHAAAEWLAAMSLRYAADLREPHATRTRDLSDIVFALARDMQPKREHELPTFDKIDLERA